MIYFIANESDTAVKVGYTSSNPLSRLAGLQTGHHEKLRLIAVTEGDEAAERRLHSIFASDRLEGEWFRPSEYLYATIDFLGEAQNFDKPKGSRARKREADEAAELERREGVRYRREWQRLHCAGRIANSAAVPQHGTAL